MSFIINAVSSCPEYVVRQADIKKILIKKWPDKTEFIEECIENSAVETRFFTLPLNYYQDLNDIGKKNIIWKAEALRLQKENIKKILAVSEINIADIGLIVSATSTGLAVPSLESLILNYFPFSPNIKKIPLFGLGCLAGVAGLNLMNDFLLGHPESAAILMVTELCSLTFQFDDASDSNIIGTSLFGDGTGAVLMVGKNHPLASRSKFEVMATESIFYPQTERLMGCDMHENGFQIIISKEIPNIVKNQLVKGIDEFLNKNKLARNDVSYYIVHPGEAKALKALSEALNHSKDKFAESWESLKNRGNTSGASVLNILEQTIDSADIAPNTLGLILALGPGLSLEMSLIKSC